MMNSAFVDTIQRTDHQNTAVPGNPHSRYFPVWTKQVLHV